MQVMTETPGAQSTTWGRIADDGTVYVRSGDGEREIGSWQAGTREEGLAYYALRYDDLAAEVGIVEARIETASVDARTVEAAARKLKDSLPTASVIGDLADLDRRLEAVLSKVEAKRAEVAAARAAASTAAADRKRALVAEAQSLAGSTDWRATGDRYRAIVEEWKSIRGVDRKTDSELWEQLSTARREFDRNRRNHFAELDKQRSQSASTKEQLAVEAEKLAESDDWGPTAKRFRDLMTEWKAAGRAGREADDALWARYKAAQDKFFTRRSEVFSARDAELTANLAAKGARKRMKTIHDKWEKIGRVPREAASALEDRLAAVEQRVRDASTSTRRIAVSESPLVTRLRESVDKLERRLARAQAAGDAALATETEQALSTQKEWLAQAEQSS
jgi:chromosome segregation ATPase